ncbi:MAG: SemiSWEET transporter [Patescibacteria group bacterium]
MNIITIIGTLAAGCTTISFLPQAIKTIKTRETKDISLLMYVLFIIGITLWLVYGVLLHEWPIIIGNSITFVLAFIVLRLKIKHG